MTYAATGAGCTGAVGAGAVLRADEEPPPVRLAVDSPSIASPVRHGPWLLVPPAWAGAIETPVRVQALPSNTQGASGASNSVGSSPVWPSNDPAEVRRHPLWSDPDLPTGWGLSAAWTERESQVDAVYRNGRYLAVRMTIWRPYAEPRPVRPLCCNVDEARVIDGHPALIWYEPDGTGPQDTLVKIYDEATGILYAIRGMDPSINHDVQAVIEIARSLYR